MARDRDDDRGRDRDDDRGRGRDRDDDRGRGRDDDRGSRASSRDDDRGRGRDDDRGRGRGDDRGRGRDDDDRGSSRGRGGGSGFTYVRRTADQIKKHGEKGGGLFDSPFKDGAKTFRPKKGESQFRILPPTWENHDHYGLSVYMHRFVGAQSSNYLCSEKMNTGKPCACCEEMRRQKKAGATKEELKDINPQQRYLYYVVDRDEEDATQPAIMDVSWSQDKAIYEQTVSDRTGETLYIDDPDAGYDVICKKTGEGMTSTKYNFMIARNPSPLHRSAKKQDDLLAYATENPIIDMLRYDTFEHIEKNLFGTVAAKDADLDRGRGRGDDDDDRGDRGRGRDRDDDRGRSRDADDAPRGRSRLDDDEDRPSDRERGRGRDRDDDDRGRGRDRVDHDDDDRGRGRGRDDADDAPRGRTRDDDDRGRDRDDDRGRDRDRDRDDDRTARGGDRERSRR